MRDEGAALLSELTADDVAALPRDNLFPGALCFLAEAAFRLGDAEPATSLEAELGPWAPRRRARATASRYIGAVNRYLALLGVARRAARRRRRAGSPRPSTSTGAWVAGVDRAHARRLGRAARGARATSTGPRWLASEAPAPGRAARARGRRPEHRASSPEESGSSDGSAADEPRVPVVPFDRARPTFGGDHDDRTATTTRTCSPTRCSPASTSGRRSTTATTASSTRTSRSCATSGYLKHRAARGVRRARAAASTRSSSCSAGSRTSRRPPPSRSTCTSTGPASPPTCGAPATRAATWILERSRRGQDLRRRATARPATTSRCCSRRRKAERVDGGWKITGHKIFGSLSPVWDYLGLHAMDTSDPDAPQIVHGFLSRDAANYRIEQTWDMLGMRATESNDTILDGAFVPDDARRRSCVRPASPAPACSRSASSRGPCSASRPSTPASRGARTT